MLKLWNKNDLGDTDLWKVMQFTSVYVLFADLIWKVYFYCCNVCQNVVVQDNERSRDIMIDHRFHKTIIGAQGAGIRDIRDKFGGVVVSFPDPSRQSDVVSLRGPKDDVDQCYKYLHQLAQDMVLLHCVLPEFPMKYFYRTILCMCGTSRGLLSVCVCLSQVGVLLKWLGSHKEHHTVAHEHCFSDAKDLREIRPESPWGHQMQAG